MFEDLMELFEQRHRKTVSMLKKMKDFSIFEFNPFSTEAVFIFLKAYDISKETFEELIQRKGGMGHSK